MKERVVMFGRSGRMIAVRLESGASSPIRMVLVNSGVIHRVGANRMTVALARSLALDGIDSLRFDMSGIGESSDRTDQLSWEASAPREIIEAIDEVAAADSNVLLYGNCGGAVKSIWAAQLDTRVKGLLLTNPPPHPSEEEGIDKEAARRIGAKIADDLAGLLARGVRMLFLFASGDSGLAYFDKYLKVPLTPHLESGVLSVEIVSHSNHTFSPAPARQAVIEIARAWLRDHFDHSPSAAREQSSRASLEPAH